MENLYLTDNDYGFSVLFICIFFMMFFFVGNEFVKGIYGIRKRSEDHKNLMETLNKILKELEKNNKLH